jgi:hypothetical protein
VKPGNERVWLGAVRGFNVSSLSLVCARRVRKVVYSYTKVYYSTFRTNPLCDGKLHPSTIFHNSRVDFHDARVFCFHR